MVSAPYSRYIDRTDRT
ncbi:Protein of unknown function [Pyronema omphalodes CBS 100304]|uniref:Uncharacterized protein n=1 Tax=Pyronema omphalodes (strain CBS 100304) TaxID=1076935 RepID=U4KWP1_PYROM|nr:Protein of unknown function [Pyronema omphalodes CBS 100304]